MNYNPKEEALRIADLIPMSDTAIEFIRNELDIAFTQGQLETVRKERDALMVVTGEMSHE